MFGQLGKQMMRQASFRMTAYHRSASTAVGSLERPKLIDCRQGEKVIPTFTQQEMQRRVDKLRAYMTEQKIEACVFTSHHNVNYFSDFLYCAFGRPYGLVVTNEQLTVIGASKCIRLTIS